MSGSSIHDASHPIPPDPRDDMTTSRVPPSPPQRPDKVQKKRRRPALACEQCRRRKIKCDRSQPCVHCVKSGITDCTYAPTHIPAASRAKKAAPASVADTQDSVRRVTPIVPRPPPASVAEEEDRLQSSRSVEHISQGAGICNIPSVPPSEPGLTASTTSPPESTNNVNWLVARVHLLEEKLENAVLLTDCETDKRLQGDVEKDRGAEYRNKPLDEVELTGDSRGTVSKTRYFGRSHWMNGATLLPIELGLLGRGKLQHDGLWHTISQCKVLARIIKHHRFQPLSTENIGKQMASRQLADALVDAYLRTFEGVFRIIHVPTFKAEYERYWQNPSGCPDYFTIQLQLVMALGAPFYDDRFDLRPQATQWVYEAQLWLMIPPEKSRMTIAGLQIMCLLTLARSICAVGQDLVWVTTGGLLRKAMYMGLHRDPRVLADMTVYRAEMRRRLWATILELNLQSSFDAGGAPLISAHDYDTTLPANLDDEELSDKPDRDAASSARPESITTQMTVPIALLKSLSLRLSVLRHANDFRANNSYDETLRCNSELTKACRLLSHNLSSHSSSTSPHKPSDFQTSMAELLLYRCFHTLHQPVIARSLDDPKFYFSRKMYLEGGLKIAHITGLSGPNRAFGPGSETQPTNTDFYRLLTNGSGTIRNIPVQSVFAVVLELIYKGKDDQSLGLGYLPAMADYDLRTTLRACKIWTLRRIQSGETNIKGYSFLGAAVGHVEALEAGLDETGIEAAILKGAEEATAQTLEELKVLAERQGIPTEGTEDAGGGDEGIASLKEVPPDDMMMSMDWMGDWQLEDLPTIPWDQPAFMMV